MLTNCDILENFPPFPFYLMPPLARMPGGMALMTAPFRLGAIGRATFAPLAKHRIDPVLVESWLEPALGDREIAARRPQADQRRAQDATRIEAAERLRDFERPVRFAWGADDRFFRIASAERLAAMLRDARIERIEDARTFVALDQPERVAELIGEFAARLAASRRPAPRAPGAGPTEGSQLDRAAGEHPQHARHVIADPASGISTSTSTVPGVARQHLGRAERREHVVHLVVAGEEQRREALDPLLAGALGEQLAERRAEAAALPVVDDGHRRLAPRSGPSMRTKRATPTASPSPSNAISASWS